MVALIPFIKDSIAVRGKDILTKHLTKQKAAGYCSINRFLSPDKPNQNSQFKHQFVKLQWLAIIKYSAIFAFISYKHDF